MVIQAISLIILIIVLLILVIYKYNKQLVFDINQQLTRYDSSNVYKVLNQIETKFITINSIPTEYQDKMSCFNIPDYKKLTTNREKCEVIIQKINDSIANKQKYVVFDLINLQGSYFPSIHTDTEWNAIQNDGFQVWCLEQNDDINYGNMFFIYNEYLLNKYKNMAIALRCTEDGIVVMKNCPSNYLWRVMKKSAILETIQISDFIKQTKKFYLKFNSGDCIVFNKDLLHMSDYRIKKTNKDRKSFNFRIVIKDDENNVSLKNDCGYLDSKDKIHKSPNYDAKKKKIYNPSMLEFI